MQQPRLDVRNPIRHPLFIVLFATSLVVVVSGMQQSFSQLSDQEIGTGINPEDFLTYNDAKNGITMLYPSDWTQEDGTETQEGLIVHHFSSPTGADGSYAFVKIVIEDPSPSRTIAEYLSLTVDTYSRDPETFPEFEVISSGTSDFTLAGRPAYDLKATYTDSGSGRPQDMLEVGTIDESNNGARAVYLQAIIDSDSDSSKYWPIAEEMINSLQFTSSGGGSGISSDAFTTQEDNSGSATVSDSTAPQTEDDYSNIESASLMDSNNPSADLTEGNNSTSALQEEEQMQEGDFFRFEYGNTHNLIESALYENTTFGVSILYPATWTQQAGTDTGDGFIYVSDFIAPDEADGSYATFSILIEDLAVLDGQSGVSADMTLEEYLSASIDFLTSDDPPPPHQIISSSMNDFTLAGRPAYSLETAYTDPEFGPQRMLEVATIIGNKAYNLQYIVEPHIYQKYLPVIEQMISSLELVSGTGVTDASATEENHDAIRNDSFELDQGNGIRSASGSEQTIGTEGANTSVGGNIIDATANATNATASGTEDGADPLEGIFGGGG